MRFVLFSAFLVALDQFTKRIVERKLELDVKLEVIKGKFYFFHLRNKGAAYGIFANNPTLLTVLTVLSCIDIFIRFRSIFKSGRGDGFYKFSLACIVGGGLGNIIDRVRKKYVTDFIYIPYSKNAPVFNLADVAVFVGAVVFMVRCFLKKDD